MLAEGSSFFDHFLGLFQGIPKGVPKGGSQRGSSEGVPRQASRIPPTRRVPQGPRLGPQGPPPTPRARASSMLASGIRVVARVGVPQDHVRPFFDNPPGRAGPQDRGGDQTPLPWDGVSGTPLPWGTLGGPGGVPWGGPWGVPPYPGPGPPYPGLGTPLPWSGTPLPWGTLGGPGGCHICAAN